MDTKDQPQQTPQRYMFRMVGIAPGRCPTAEECEYLAGSLISQSLGDAVRELLRDDKIPIVQIALPGPGSQVAFAQVDDLGTNPELRELVESEKQGGIHPDDVVVLVWAPPSDDDPSGRPLCLMCGAYAPSAVASKWIQ